MCARACACVLARARWFCPASCFLMQHRTLSPGLLGDLVMFFFPFLSSQETRTNCCAVAIGVGEVCFPSTFIPGTSPSTVTVETRATLTLFPSMSPSFNDLTLLSFFTRPHSAYLPTLQQPMNCGEHGVTSLKRICIKAEIRKRRFAG